MVKDTLCHPQIAILTENEEEMEVRVPSDFLSKKMLLKKASHSSVINIRMVQLNPAIRPHYTIGVE